MYKVFIENKAVIFKINKESKEAYLTRKEIWNNISWLCSTNMDGIVFEIKNEKSFWKIFKAHKYIEAAGGLVERKGKFLFIKRNNVWDIPKGKLEKNEKIKVAAIREVEEECGLTKPKIKQHLIDTFHTYYIKGKPYLKRTFWFWMKEGKTKTKLIPQTEEGITKVKYLSPKKFEKVKENTYQSIIEVINKLEENLN